MYEDIKEVIKEIGDKPASLILLIFSCIFILLSIQYDRYIFQSFLTLFYALVNQYLILMRKHETMGEFLVSTKLRVFFYSLFYFLPLIAWVIIIMLSLIKPGFFQNNLRSILITFGIASAIYMIWLGVLIVTYIGTPGKESNPKK